jgi:hypothetical protein
MFFIITGSHAQIWISPSEKDDSKRAIDQKLLVEIFEINEKTLSKLSSDEQAGYKKLVEDWNELLKLSFKKYWRLHSSPEFLSYTEIQNKIKEQDSYTVFLARPFASSTMQNQSDAEAIPCAYSVYLTKKGKFKSMPETEFVVMNKAETEMEYKFILYNLSKYLNAEAEGKNYRDESLYNKDKNFQTLTEKTLFFDNDMIDPDYSQQEAEQAYPHKIKFCNGDEIYQVQEKQDEGSLFLTYLLNQSFDTWAYAIVDASTMDIIAMQTPARVHFAIGKQFTTDSHAKALAGKYGGTPFLYKEPVKIWQSRTKIQLSKKDFKYLGAKATVNMN